MELKQMTKEHHRKKGCSSVEDPGNPLDLLTWGQKEVCQQAPVLVLSDQDALHKELGWK